MQTFMEDLEEHVEEWTKEGYQIIVMVDLNKYFYCQRVRTLFYTLGLRELIIKKQGSEGLALTIPKKKNHAIDRI